MAGVQRVASLAKRWILETHPGSIQTGQLVAYLEEFVFSFNRRASGSRGMLLYASPLPVQRSPAMLKPPSTSTLWPVM